MDERAKTAASKFLSLVLRHQPEVAGLTLDAAGWVNVDALLEGCAACGNGLTRAQLEHIVSTSSKQRFAFSEDGLRIRANQGHSTEVELGLTPVEPPTRLFHGTVAAALPAIRAAGLQRMARHHVHLSADEGTALAVGGRRGKPVLLRVDAGAMHAAGHLFYLSANGVWLTTDVPSAFIEGLSAG
ncbi:MAG: RNA 2'-phosphotransferase [Sandaracinaceae bacterium]|nr:RNA 2'-phosphotransferase [Sandaracinaceae bacterium]